jgi:hypothetical protein
MTKTERNTIMNILNRYPKQTLQSLKKYITCVKKKYITKLSLIMRHEKIKTTQENKNHDIIHMLISDSLWSCYTILYLNSSKPSRFQYL